MAQVTFESGITKTVKNLGWLFRHKKQVKAIAMYKFGDSFELSVSGANWVFNTVYHSPPIFHAIINRSRMLAGKPITWIDGKFYTVGSDEFKTLYKN